MNRKGLWLSVILVCLEFVSFSQGFVENALLFSRTKPGGSARIQAIGGSQVALGGDYSSALSNPAGLGMYNRSEFTFSPALNFYKSEASYLENSENSSQTKFNIPGLSLVYHYPKEKGKFLGGSLGISMTRINDFNNEFHYYGTDNASSIIDYFKETAQGYTIDPLPSPYDDTPLLNFDFPEGLAYNTYLITPLNEDPDNTNPAMPDDFIHYYSDLDTLTGEIRTQKRNERVKTAGAQYQWSFAYGGNYDDKLFFGASIGVTTLRYTFSRNYQESDYEFNSRPDYDTLDYMKFQESITIDGTGVNLTIGIIYRPINLVQLGLSFVTPTAYTLSDSYSASMQAQWNGPPGYVEQSSSAPAELEYNFISPLKFSTGATFFLGKYGFISGDVEFVNYSKSKYSSNTPGVSFDLDNQDIRYYYSDVINYRVGTELRYSIYRLRGGYNFQANPYKSTFGVNRSIESFSIGGGVKLQKVSIDFAWMSSSGLATYSPYALSNGTGPVVSLNNKMTSAMMTLGYFF